MCLHLPHDHTQSSRSPSHPLFLFSPWGPVLWDFWLRLKSLTEESHQLELAQEKQTAQLEALPRSNRKLHPASLWAVWRLTWGLSHGKIPTLWERNSACFCSEILQHFFLSLCIDYECSTGQYTPKSSVWSWETKPEHNFSRRGLSILSHLWFTLNYTMDDQSSQKWIPTENVFLSNLFHMCLKVVQVVWVQNLCVRKTSSFEPSHQLLNWFTYGVKLESTLVKWQ